MKITLKDGSVREYSEAMTVNDIAFDISGGLGRAACAGEVDGEVVDLRTTVDKDCTLNILTFKDEAGKAAYRHTASHVLAEAVKNLLLKMVHCQNHNRNHHQLKVQLLI